ncbi:uncharacterized protein LOC144088333 [Stigmatopora argus]
MGALRLPRSRSSPRRFICQRPRRRVSARDVPPRSRRPERPRSGSPLSEATCWESFPRSALESSRRSALRSAEGFRRRSRPGPLACRPPEGRSTQVPETLSSLERLSQATGGMEKSWYRCIFPFGIISLVIGAAGTAVTYAYQDLPQTKVASLVLLASGISLLLTAAACWTGRRKRRKEKEGGAERCPP